MRPIHDKRLSVVLPAYNEEENILTAAAVLSNVLQNQIDRYELIFVNDGSKDRTWERINEARRSNEHVRGICFSRNFGKEAAIDAGLHYAAGDAVIVMDCDLQHPPETILNMMELWQQGYDVVEGIKTNRGHESCLHKAAAETFYKIISSATGIDMSSASDFKLMDRKAVDALLRLSEHDSFFRALSSWVGFRTASVGFEVQERAGGSSKWSTKALIKYALSNITSFTTLPLQLVTIGGVFVFFLAVIMGIQTLWHWAAGNAVEGFTTVILLILIIGSILMISLGIIGYYIAKIYEEVKRRPKYIVMEEV